MSKELEKAKAWMLAQEFSKVLNKFELEVMCQVAVDYANQVTKDPLSLKLDDELEPLSEPESWQNYLEFSGPEVSGLKKEIIEYQNAKTIRERLEESKADKERIEFLENELKSLAAKMQYKGNNVSYIYEKMTNYGNQAAKFKKQLQQKEEEVKQLKSVINKINTATKQDWEHESIVMKIEQLLNKQ